MANDTLDKEEIAPTFAHYDKANIPTINLNNITLHIASGEWSGVKSPVITHNDALFVECHMHSGASMIIPATMEERAIHILTGHVTVDNTNYNNVRMLILKSGVDVKITATSRAHLIILGGSPLETPRFLWWNFVASSKDRIEQAKQDWLSGNFGKIPGDDQEFIPLPTQ